MDSVLYCIPTHRVGKGLANYVLYGLYIQPYIFCCHLLVYIYPYITSSAPDRSRSPKRITCSYGTSPTFRCAFQTPPAGFTCCQSAVSSIPTRRTTTSAAAHRALLRSAPPSCSACTFEPPTDTAHRPAAHHSVRSALSSLVALATTSSGFASVSSGTGRTIVSRPFSLLER